MRDQWRAEDDNRDSYRPTGRGLSVRRQASSAAPQQQKGTDVELKIKGRAVADSTPRSPLRNSTADRLGSSKEEIRRKVSRSSQRRRPREDERTKRPHAPSVERRPDKFGQLDEIDTLKKRRRTRSRSPTRERFNSRDERRRPRSPIYSGRIDRFRPSSRRRERPSSPPRSSRGDHYSSSYPETGSLACRFGDSYVPSSRRRSSPPASEETKRLSHRRCSRSRDRYPEPQRASSFHRRRTSSPSGSFRREKHTRSNHRQVPRAENSPRRSEEAIRYQKTPTPSSHEDKKRPRREQRSPTPEGWEGARSDHTKMQSSTRPIQSILVDGSRPPSPPRPIPSFDSVPQNSVAISEAFPLHGMRASEIHGMPGTHRPNRPPNLNTQHAYSTSPQWTPTSSHHGSPHSGSPYSQARGGWSGQQQQFQGQSRCVLLQRFVSMY